MVKAKEEVQEDLLVDSMQMAPLEAREEMEHPVVELLVAYYMTVIDLMLEEVLEEALL